jgi:hypothetical protein
VRGILRAAGVSLVLLLGCDRLGGCDFQSHGACIQFTYDTSQVPDVKARVDRLLELEMPFWGLHAIEGWRIQFRDSPNYNCYLNLNNSGCTNYFDQEMSVWVESNFDGCFEAAPLLHELGHYTLGDPTHSDPRWHDVPGQFAPIVWDRPDAAASCKKRFDGVYTGMWSVNFNGF